MDTLTRANPHKSIPRAHFGSWLTAGVNWQKKTGALLTMVGASDNGGDRRQLCIVDPSAGERLSFG